MIEKVIITLQANSREIDIELPVDVPIGVLKPNIHVALKSKGLNISPMFDLTSKGRIFAEEETLGELEIWDGALVSVS